MGLDTLIVAILLGSIATEAITNHVLKQDVFKHFRQLLQKVPFVSKLMTCPDCFSQWAAWLTTGVFLLALGTEITLMSTVGWFFGSFVTCRLSNIFHDIKDLIAMKSAILKVPK